MWERFIDILITKEIEDIDLVFKLSKLKNDHIRFKLVNFDKVGTTKTAWTVTKPTECDLGKWIVKQENIGTSFTKTQNCKNLKLNHDLVHTSLQEYINEDCKEISDSNLLKDRSVSLDKATVEVFKCLDQLKTDNVFEQKVKHSEKEIFKIEQKEKKEIKKPSNISSNTNNDEWESF